MDASPARPGRLTVLRDLFVRRDDPYAGADLQNAKRLSVALSLIGGVIAIVLLPFWPPLEAIGRAGWLLTAGLAVNTLLGVRQVRVASTGFGQMLLACYVAAGQVAVLQWLAGGGDAPYQQLYLLCFIICAATHPPRRAAICIGAASAAFLAPLWYAGFSYGGLVSGLTQLLIWWGMCLATMVLMVGVRAQRLQGQADSRLARADSLTGLGNRRAFEEAVTREVSRARRSGRPVSLLLADLDDFKGINDRYGHPAGDDCLRQVAEALRLTVRAGDLCFRWGGDEFVALLPETDLLGARLVRDRLCATVEAARLGPEDRALTITCGLSELDEATSTEGLVAAADMDLLISKRDGADEAEQDAEHSHPTT